MKRVFKVRLRRAPHISEIPTTYECISTNAKDAIDKAVQKFKGEEKWSGAVLVEAVIHRGPAI